MTSPYTYKEIDTTGPPKSPELLGDSADSMSSQPPKYEDIELGSRSAASGTSSRVACKPANGRQRINSGDVACAIDYGREDEETPSDDFNLFSSFIQAHSTLTDFYRSRKQNFCWVFYTILGVGYLAYFVSAMVLCTREGLRDPTPLAALTGVTLVLLILWFVGGRYGDQIRTAGVQPVTDFFRNKRKVLRIVKVLFMVAMVLTVLVIIGTSVLVRPSNAISLAGIIFFLLMMWLCSAHPTKVNWRPVVGGILLQFFFASLILKLSVGSAVFKFLGEKVQTFLSFTNNGTQFVFGDKYTDHFFAMKVLPVIVFFSCAISVLYYLGVMQVVIEKIAWVMRVTLGTTAAESLVAAGNIFIGQTEAPILIRPYLDLMTKSELHAVTTCGFATIAGGVMAAYIEFGVPAEHLLCASVMNAPAALAVSKLLYPETEQSRLKRVTGGRPECAEEGSEENSHPESCIKPEQPKEKNVLEAAAGGASASIKLVANIAANLIAFLAMLAFVNAMLGWFGSFVGIPDFSFQMVCGYVLMPVAYLMGVDWADAGLVGELIGIKTFLNEFIAYSDLSTYIKNREDCLDGTVLSVRSEIIATYALCGFSNLGAIGIQLGGLGPMAPHRKGDLASVIIRSLLGGIVTGLLTASMAGLLVTEFPAPPSCLLTQNFTTTAFAGNVAAFLESNITMTDPLSVVYNSTLPTL